MFKKIFHIALAALTVFGAIGPAPLLSGVARAASPNTLSYQGRLKDDDGVVVADGDYDFTFTLWTDLAAGAADWTEDQTLTVTDGYFSAQLGSVDPFMDGVGEDTSFTVPLWLEIEVEAETLAPRVAVNSVAYSFSSRSIESYASEAAAEADSANFGGRMYYNTTDGNLYVYDSVATDWVDTTGAGGADDLDEAYNNFGATAATVTVDNAQGQGNLNFRMNGADLVMTDSLAETFVTFGDDGITTIAKALAANGTVTLGDNGDTVAINSSDWDITATGEMTGIGALTMDGNFSQSGATTFSTGTGAVSLNGAVTAGSTLAVTGNTTLTGDLAVNGDDITSDGDLTLTVTGGQLLLADTNVFNIGGVTDLAYNAISNLGGTADSVNVAGDNDLYIQDDLEVDGTSVFDGNVDLDGAVTVNAVTTFNASPVFNSTITADGAIEANGGITTQDGTALTLNSGDVDAINIGNDADAESINIGTGAATKTITIGNGNGATVLRIDTGTGGVDIDLLGVMSVDGDLLVVGGAAGGNTAAGDGDLYVVGDFEADGIADLDGSFDFDGTTFDADGSGLVSFTSTGSSVTVAASDSGNIGDDSVVLTAGNAAPDAAEDGNDVAFESEDDVLIEATDNFDVDAADMVVLTSGSISLDAGAASNFTTSAGALTLNGNGGVNVAGNAAEIDLTTTDAVDINSGPGTWDASTLSIDSTDTTNLTMSANDPGTKTLNIAATNSGAGVGRVGINSDGGVSIDAQDASNFTVTGAADLTLSSTAGSVVASSGQAAADAIRILASNAAGGIDIDAGTAGIDVDSTGVMSFDGELVAIGGSGPGDTATGDADLYVVGDFEVDLTSRFDGAATFNGGITSTAGEVLVSGGNVQLNDNVVLALGTGNDIELVHDGVNTTVTNITGNLDISNSGGTLDINASGGAINVGDDADAQAINVGTGAAARTITIGNGTLGTALNFDTGTGGFDVDLLGVMSIDGDLVAIGGSGPGDTANDDGDLYVVGDFEANGVADLDGSFDFDGTTFDADGSGLVSMTSTGASLTLAASDTGDVNDDNVVLTAGNATPDAGENGNDVAVETEDAFLVQTGGVADFDVGTAFNVDAVGSITLTSTNNAVDAINLTTNAGVAETIQLWAQQGTAVNSINVLSDAGGITLGSGLGSADAINITAENAAGGIDIGAGTAGIDVDSTGVMSFDGELVAIGGSGPGDTATGDADLYVVGDFEVDLTSRFDGAATFNGGLTVSAGDIALTDNSGTTWSITNAGVAQFGASVTIAGTGDGTDALILTLGDILVSNGDFTMSGGDFDVTLDGADSASVTNNTATTASGAFVVNQVTNASNTGNSAGLGVNATFTDYADDNDEDNRQGAIITVTNNASDLLGVDDIISGLRINDLSGANQADGKEWAIRIGTGWDADLSFGRGEMLSNQVDDLIVLSGAGGINNTSITFDLDGASVTNVPSIVSGGSDLVTVNDSLSVGIDGETTENLTNPTFAFGAGNDLYVEDMLGVNGNIFTDGLLTLQGTGDGTDSILVTTGDIRVADGDFQLLAGDFNVFLDTGDTALFRPNAAATVPVLDVSMPSTADVGTVSALIVNATASDQANRLVRGMEINMTSQGTAPTDNTTGLLVNLQSTAGGTDKAIEIENTAAWDRDLELQNDEWIGNVNNGAVTFNGDAGANNASITFDLDANSAGNVPAIVSGGSDLLTVFDSLSVGIDGNTTENLTNPTFAFGAGNDLYVEDMLGVNGNIFTDGQLTLQGTGDGNDSIVVTTGDILVSDGDLDVSGGDFNVALDSGDGASIANASATTSAPALIVNQTTTDATYQGNVAGASVNMTLGQYNDDGDADNRDAFSIGVTNNATDVGLDDAVTALNIKGLSGSNNPDGTEYAISIGTSWDADLRLGNNETVSNQTDDTIVFGGNGGTNNTSLTIDVDGAAATVPTIVGGASDLVAVNDSLSVGADGTAAENIVNAGFAFGAGDDLYVEDDVGIDGDLYVDGPASFDGGYGLGAAMTILAAGTTPSVAGGSHFLFENGTAQTLTDFSGAYVGQVIFVRAGAADDTLDCTTSQLTCGSTDIVLGNGDGTMWVRTDAGGWQLIAMMDQSDNHNAGNGFDLAEWFQSSEQLAAGDVVSVDPNGVETIRKSQGAYESSVVGIVSTEPGITLGAPASGFASQIALAGRVPVNVSNENGAIVPGDYLTTSSTPGVAMKATEAGPVIGIAMSSSDGASGQVIAKIASFWYVPPASEASSLQGSDGSALSAGVLSAESVVVSGNAVFEGSVTVEGHLYGSADMAGRARINTGDTRVHVPFTEEYASQPIVTATLRTATDIPGYWWVEGESTTGFDLVLDGTLAYPVEFNWIALGVEAGRVSVSDGSSQEINVYVVDGGAAPELEAPVVEEPAAEEPVVIEEAPAPVEEAPAPAEEPVVVEEPAAEPAPEPIVEEAPVVVEEPAEEVIL